MQAVATDWHPHLLGQHGERSRVQSGTVCGEMGCPLPQQKPHPGAPDFPRVIPLFAFPEDIRRVIYTTNATPVGEHDPAQGHAQSPDFSLR